MTTMAGTYDLVATLASLDMADFTHVDVLGRPLNVDA
jgi:hypothetical protein